MWNKPESSSAEAATARPLAVDRQGAALRVAGIGPSIAIEGEVSGAEDLVIEGRVDGKITVEKHSVKVAAGGRVRADVIGRSITVEGEVVGNLIAEERVEIRESGRVKGNLTAPRVILENGAKLRGSVDMQPEASEGAEPKAVRKTKAESDLGGGGGAERVGAAAAPTRSSTG